MVTTAMHIQWKHYKAKDGAISIRLYIRSSHRENGKVRSSVHGYLGSYRLDRLALPLKLGSFGRKSTPLSSALTTPLFQANGKS
jgi:hypothetical protein